MADSIVENEARRLCKVCGTPILGRGRKEYCSDACRRIWGRRPHWRNCNLCGEMFFSQDGEKRCEDCKKKRSLAQHRGRQKIVRGAPFEDFLRAQRRAREAGKELTYGQWQRNKYGSR